MTRYKRKIFPTGIFYNDAENVVKFTKKLLKKQKSFAEVYDEAGLVVSKAINRELCNILNEVEIEWTRPAGKLNQTRQGLRNFAWHRARPAPTVPEISKKYFLKLESKDNLVIRFSDRAGDACYFIRTDLFRVLSAGWVINVGDFVTFNANLKDIKLTGRYEHIEHQKMMVKIEIISFIDTRRPRPGWIAPPEKYYEKYYVNTKEKD